MATDDCGCFWILKSGVGEGVCGEEKGDHEIVKVSFQLHSKRVLLSIRCFSCVLNTQHFFEAASTLGLLICL